jgi:4-hydroxy-4-methyl-2-oxoglutarate aldolase
MLKDPPILTIRRAFQRPSRELLQRLRGAQTGQVIDAMQGRGALHNAVKPVDPAHTHFIGTALPCETGANDNLAILAALVQAEPGDVIVVAADGFAETAVVGDNVLAMARNKGVAAIVVDGMVRDLEGIIGVGLPLFARGITPNSCVRSGPGRVGLPIVCAGVAVEPGDVVMGDRDGAVVIPQRDLARIADVLEDIRRMESESQKKIAAGMTHPEAIADLLKSDRVAYLD